MLKFFSPIHRASSTAQGAVLQSSKHIVSRIVDTFQHLTTASVQVS